MSEYNRIISIPIDSISKDELGKAIKEWAEGSEGMEKLLWTMYNNGLKTSGCHAGMKPYVYMNYDPNNVKLNSVIINSVLGTEDTQVLFSPDGGNFLGGDEWYKPSLGIGYGSEFKAEAEANFNNLNNAINGTEITPINIDPTPIYKINEFLQEKYTKILIRMRHDSDNNYLLSYETATEDYSDKYNYLNNSLNGLGFKTERLGNTPHVDWTYSTKDLNDFNRILSESSESMINNFNLTVPKTIEEAGDNVIAQAHILRKTDPEMFKSWKDNYKMQLDNEMRIAREKEMASKSENKEYQHN